MTIPQSREAACKKGRNLSLSFLLTRGEGDRLQNGSIMQLMWKIFLWLDLPLEKYPLRGRNDSVGF